MSKTPFTREHRESIERLRENVVHERLIAALDAVLEHLPEPEPEPETLPDGLYIYDMRTMRDGMGLRFVRDGRQSIIANADLSGPKDGYPVTPHNHALYQPVSLIVRTSDGGVEDAAVSAVHRRLLEKGSEGLAHLSHSTVRGILQALPHGVVGR